MPYEKYSPKQKRLAAMAGDRKKITAADLKAVAKKRMLNGRPSKADKMNPTLKQMAMKKMKAKKKKTA
jgi:hypothetical protein